MRRAEFETYLIDFDEMRFDDISSYEFEVRMSTVHRSCQFDASQFREREKALHPMSQSSLASRKEIVQHDDIMTHEHQPIDKM